MKVTFTSPSKNSDRKEKKKQEIDVDIGVCVLNLLSIVSILPVLRAISFVKIEIQTVA